MNVRVLVAGAFTAAFIYFAAVALFLPSVYSSMLAPPRPIPMITNVSISDETIVLGGEFSIRISAVNRGDPADLQLVSISFPNATKTDIITIRDHNFKQTPFFIRQGDLIGSGYSGLQRTVTASYPAVEAVSRPWEPGEVFNIDISVSPETEGRFVLFVKAIGLPHNGDQAHYPGSGIKDQQDEYVSVYDVQVTKG